MILQHYIREKQAGRNWQRYAERTADYAFGPAEDRDLVRNEYRDLWRRVEGLVRQQDKKTMCMGM